MASRFHKILKGDFLTQEGAAKNWRFILFMALLALIMIYTGHSFEKKVHRLSKLNDEVNELRSEFYDLENKLMFMQMESEGAKRLKESGIAPAQEPPQKIKIKLPVDGNNG